MGSRKAPYLPDSPIDGKQKGTVASVATVPFSSGDQGYLVRGLSSMLLAVATLSVYSLRRVRPAHYGQDQKGHVMLRG